MIIAQYGFIGLEIAWIALFVLFVAYCVGISIGWLCASGLRRESLRMRWFDWLMFIGSILPAFWLWLLILRANHAIYDSDPIGVLGFSLIVAICIGLVAGLFTFLIMPGHRRRFFSNNKQ